MTVKVSPVSNNIVYDSAGINTIRPGLSAAAWEAGVVSTLNILNVGSTQSSRLVLASLVSTGRTIKIIPAAAPGAAGFPQASASPDHPEDATPAGQQSLACSGNAAQINQPIPGVATGTGAGTNVTVRFAGQDAIASAANVLATSSDEVLFHELVHALRQARGQSHCEAIQSGLKSIDTAPASSNNAQFYDTLEEFVAIVVSNIYRSESRKSGLRRDHHGAAALNFPLTSATSFSQAWSRQMQRMLDEMQLLCFDLGRLDVSYNPIREFLKTKNIL